MKHRAWQRGPSARYRGQETTPTLPFSLPVYYLPDQPSYP